jgi:hypothetical protein
MKAPFSRGDGECSPRLTRKSLKRANLKSLDIEKLSFAGYARSVGSRAPGGETLPVSPSTPALAIQRARAADSSAIECKTITRQEN